MGWVITPRVLSCQSYHALPDRRIVFSPFHRRRIVSYGTIVYCPSSHRWLLVRTRWSYAFTTVMSGAFQKSDIPVIMSHLTLEELLLLKQMVHGSVDWKNYRLGMSDDERFLTQWDLVRPHFMRLTSQPKTTSTAWTFPKGRLEANESPYKCALREYEEETGLSASSLGVPIVSDIITETYMSFDRYVYETKCWIFSLHASAPEPVLSQPADGEIAERKWCSMEEAQKLLSPSKYAMLLQAKSRIDCEIQTTAT